MTSSLPRQGQTQVGVQTALVELVEQNRAYAFQTGIIQNHPREDALGDDLDSRLRPDAALQPGAVADGFAGRLIQAGRHPLRRRARRQPPRLQHQHPSRAQPGLIQQGQRNNGRLARPWRRRQHGDVRRRQRRLQRLQNRMDGQHDDRRLGLSRTPRPASGGGV